MNPREAVAVLLELGRRFKPAPVVTSAKRAWRWLTALHRKQKEFHALPGKRKAALCSRRAGKSFWAAAALLEAAFNEPDSLAAYLTLTRESARRIMWRELKRFDRKYHLGLKFNETKLVCTLPNESEIFLLGAVNEADIEKLRGASFTLVVIDEAASFPVRKSAEKAGEKSTGDLLERLWKDVLQPAMLDHQGTVVLIGTPAAHCSGFFHSITHEDPAQRRKGWEVMTWTVLDNPFVPKKPTPEVPDAATWLRKMMEDEGIDESDPSFQREWRARWVKSEDALVYHRFNTVLNTYTTIKDEKKVEWFYGVSVDLGYDDPTVIGLFRWSLNRPEVYLDKVFKKSGMIPAQIATEIRRIEKQVGSLAFVVVDQGGGAGKMIAEEFRTRWGIDCVGAEKTKKPTFIELCNGDLASGRFKIHAKNALAVLDEISVLQWDPRYPGKKEDERFPNDACDMMLYGWRECRGYAFDADKLPAELEKSPQEADEDDMEMEAEAALAAREEEDWFGPG